jgi:hypothetical protein
MGVMKRLVALSALSSLIVITAACSSSITLTDEPTATLGAPETTIVSAEPTTSEQTTESSVVINSTEDDSAESSSETTETTTATETTTPVERETPAEPELSPELIAARDDLQSQYASSRLYGPISTERCGVRAGILIGPERWGPLADAEDSRIPEAAMFNLVDGEWVRTDHISYENAVSNGVTAGAFTRISFINMDGYNEPVLIRAESTNDGDYVTTKKLDSNCRWWDRPVITLCGVNRIASEISKSGSMTMSPQSLYNENPWPCEPAGPIPVRWNPEFQMIEPAVSGADWCRSYVSDTEVDYPLAPCTQGDTVAAVQNGLAAAGYNIDADGYFGPGTMRTIMRYQQGQGLDITGVVSADLAIALTDDGSGGGDE